MPFDAQVNWRASSGYVTDGAGQTYFIATGDAYPTTRGGLTFGYEDAGTDARDRTTSNDVRLAGTGYSAAGSAARLFRLDLPSAGNYDVRIAVGDPNFASSDYGRDFDVRIRDTTTEVLQVTGATGTGQFLDATSVARSAAAWPGSNVAATLTFATTILRVYAPLGDSRTMVSHIRVTVSAGAAAKAGAIYQAMLSGGVPL